MSFNVTKIKCLGQSVFVEVFVEDATTINGPGGTKIKIDKPNSVMPEPYAYVHSVGPDVKGINVGDWVILKPMNKGGFQIEGAKYAFISGYEIDAVISEDVKHYFANTKRNSPVQPSQDLIN